MDRSRILRAMRELVEAAEAQGWDGEPGLTEALEAGRDAYAALRKLWSDADPDREADGLNPGDA